MECRVIPVGEKIKKLRERYGLNQDEIVGTDITRNLISQIENSKAKLTKSTAEIVIKHATEKLKERNITLDVDIEYLLEDEEAQARKILDGFIEELSELAKNKDSSYVESFKKAEEFMLKWNFIDKKIIICEITGDYFYGKNDFYKASVYYENTKCLMNLDMETEPLIQLLQKLSNTYYFMGNLSEGINTCNYALDRFPEMDNEKKVGFLFNIGLYYNYLHEYDKSVSFIDKVASMIDKKEKGYAKILLLRASSLSSLKFYEEALNIYNELIEMTESKDYAHRALYYNNICETYIELQQFDTANKYLRLALDNLTLVQKDFSMLPHIYFDIAKWYVRLQDSEKSSIFFKQALSLSKDFKYSLVIKDILHEIIHINDYKVDIDIKDEFKQLLMETKTLDNLLLVDILKYFTSLDDKESVLELCDFCRVNFENIKEGSEINV
ncbi:helix-turn-helix transcriptional regulator [Clostridium sp. 19966]|uniref:helix-turn-helix domain-containing protein n=1 Tax=Clostridium sp. 19966 TaxID=2768166 RepID=UPI0028DFC00C|nr:helix-turn-helix transcriptional regulator [Clostridium sp. 19966]MDT8717760.1 helix-turn-helix transcriptional regulator [Clostridium sp. 19966]